MFESRRTANQKIISRVRIMVTVGFAAVAVAGGIVAYRLRQPPPAPPEVSFDVKKCVRMQRVSRLFAVRADPRRPDLVWFCSAQGLRRLDQAAAAWKRYGLDSGLPAETVNDICFADGRVWVATDKGIAFLTDADTFSVPRSSPRGAALAIDNLPGGGVVYAAVGAGLFRCAHPDSPAVAMPVADTAAGARITCLRSIDTVLYAGVEGVGLFARGASGRWRSMPFSQPLSRGTQFTNVMKHRGGLWVATSIDGIWRAGATSDTLVPVTAFPAKGAYVFAEESDGLWCGTPWGLWRYHDREDVWLQFLHPLENNPGDFQVVALCATERLLWYGSTDLGVGYFNKERVQWQPLRAGLSSDNVAAIATCDSDLYVGYGYQGNSVDHFDASSLQYQGNIGSEDGVGDANVQCFAAEGRRVCYGGFRGFGCIDLDKSTNRGVDLLSLLPSTDIAAIVTAAAPPWFLAGSPGVVVYNPVDNFFSVLKGTERCRITSILPRGDTLWLGTLGRGVVAYNRVTGAMGDFLCPESRRITGLAPVDSGGMFIATIDKGCFLLRPSGARPQAVPLWEGARPPRDGEIETDDDVMALRPIDGRIWLGTRDNGCAIYEPRTGRWLRLTMSNGLISGRVRALWDDSSYVWVGCYGGVNRFDKSYLAEMWKGR